MHPEQIKAAIRMKGTTPSAIAVELGVSSNSVSHVIHGRGTSARVARCISNVTGLSVHILWPGKYEITHASQAAAAVARRAVA